ncbi:DENN domain-containing protein 11 [Caerostris extrusa]|uniref:DENN domain-containing protein 11 n=1 Tax=Caerostris extrusa TaxID=172846 RepID=A0AAV4RH41_CAEEX|nr:DENN domain-containing protein 11 [Caerostris extrusa]
MSPVEVNGANNTEPADIVCIFSVAFDTRAGNIIEWYLPNDCNVDGIEFRAMASGSHRVQTDFIYFKRGQLYGLACFENMPVDNACERGARMKSQVRQLLENPGSYTEMETYYENHKGSFPTFNAFSDQLNGDNIKLWNNIMPMMKITHPAGCFSQFLNFFGERIFVLWKLVLLRKRIIFFSPASNWRCLLQSILYYFSYCTSFIRNWLLVFTTFLFYVNIADMDTLASEKVFVACTTEKIFQSKTNLYDLYVDNQNFVSDIPLIQKLMGVSYADRKKYEELCKLQSQNTLQNGDLDSGENDETWFMRYFMNLNDKLFRRLLDVSQSEDKQWTIEHMHAVGLDPVNDRTFIMELVDTYGIDIVAAPDTLCCSP